MGLPAAAAHANSRKVHLITSTPQRLPHGSRSRVRFQLQCRTQILKGVRLSARAGGGDRLHCSPTQQGTANNGVSFKITREEALKMFEMIIC